MKHAREYNIKFLVSISTLIIITIWIVWIIKFSPYTYNKLDVTQSDTLDQTIQATNNWREQIKESQQQLELIKKFISNQQNTTISNASTTAELETSPEIINSMKAYIASSTATTTPL